MKTKFNCNINIPGKAIGADEDIKADINISIDYTEKEFIALTQSQSKIFKALAPVFKKAIKAIENINSK